MYIFLYIHIYIYLSLKLNMHGKDLKECDQHANDVGIAELFPLCVSTFSITYFSYFAIISLLLTWLKKTYKVSLTTPLLLFIEIIYFFGSSNGIQHLVLTSQEHCHWALSPALNNTFIDTWWLSCLQLSEKSASSSKEVWCFTCTMGKRLWP